MMAVKVSKRISVPCLVDLVRRVKNDSTRRKRVLADLVCVEMRRHVIID